MTDAFSACLAETLHHEGGFSNDPHDPGGMTCCGVTRDVWEQWTGKAACEADMRALTPAKVSPLYRANYWNAVSGDKLPPPIAQCVFDFAVNAGVSRAARYLQRLVGVADDGHIGPHTLSALATYMGQHGQAGTVAAYQDARRAYYHQLGTFPLYGKGWLRRVDDVERAALELVK